MGKAEKFLTTLILIILLGVLPKSLCAQSNNLPTLKALPSSAISKIAFGSCAKHWQYQPIWKTVIAKKPDLFLYVGDAIYADTDGKTAWQVSAKQLNGEWNRLADKPELQAARTEIPFMATWDNHDYGSHSGGSEFSMKRESQEAFLNFFNEPENSQRRKSEGIYDSKIFGEIGKRVQIILLDTRYFKSKPIKDTRTKKQKQVLGIVGNYLPNKNQNATLLGTEQWEWLEKELKKPVELRIIVSSTQVVADQKAMDEWGNYPYEREKLLKLIEKEDKASILILSGNVHFSEISAYNFKHKKVLDFTSSGLTHINNKYAAKKNKYRVKGPFVNLNFGLIEINWDEGSLDLQVIGLDGQVGYSYKTQINRLNQK